MASVKGLLVEIGGDTSGLQNALKKVNSSTSSLSKELRGINSLLKLDPKNTELLKQKQDVLNESIKTTQEKLKELKEAKEKADEAMSNGTEISAESYRNLQREIINTENKLKNLKLEASKWTSAGESIQEFGTKVDGIGNKVGNLGSKLTKTATPAIVATATLAVTSMDAVDEGLDTVAKKTGATGDGAKELQKIYKEVASEVPAEFGDIGAAVGEINTRLDFTGDKLKSASKAFLKFAKVNDVDVNTAVQLVTRAMGDAGIEADNYAELLDMLTVAGQKSGISIDSLATNLAKYGAPMRALGIDTENAIAMFAGWEKAGVNTEIAFSGMKKAISNWGAAGKDSTKEFSKTLEEIKKCPTIAKATTKAIEVFGAKAGPDLADAIKGGRFEFDKYVKALKEGGGTLENTYGQITDEVDDAQLAMQNIQIAFHDTGEVAMKTLAPKLLNLAKDFKSLMEKFDRLDPKLKQNIVRFTALGAVLGPIIKTGGTLISGVGKGISSVGKLCKTVAQVKSGMAVANNATGLLAKGIAGLATPTGLAIAGVTALIGAYTAHELAVKEQKSSLDGLRDKIKEQRDSWNELAKTRQETLANNMVEIDNTQELAKELKNITDENGKVKTSCETRAKYILGELNQALGTEYKLNGNIIENYKDMQGEIDKLITKKRAEIVLNAYNNEYVEAKKNEKTATEQLVKLKQQQIEAAEKMATGNAKERAEAELLYSSIGKKIGEQTEQIGKYGKTIQDYETLQVASAEGSSDAVNKAIENINVSYDKLKEKSGQSIEEQVKNQAKYVENLKTCLQEAKNSNDTYQAQILEKQLSSSQEQLNNLVNSLVNQTSTIKELSPEQIEAWKLVAQQDYEGYSQGLSKLPEEMRKKIQEATGVVVVDGQAISDNFKTTGENSVTLFKDRLDLLKPVQAEISKAATDISNNTSVPDEAGELADKANDKIKEKNSYQWGADLSSNIASGMASKESKGLITGAAGAVAGWIKSILGHSVPEAGPLKDELTYMPDMIDNLVKGINKNKYKVAKASEKLAGDMKAKMLDISKLDFGNINISSRIIDSQKTIFTTPQIIFNVQELDEGKLQQCFNYINRKFGSKY